MFFSKKSKKPSVAKLSFETIEKDQMFALNGGAINDCSCNTQSICHMDGVTDCDCTDPR